MWTVLLCVVVTAELALGAWAVSAAIAKASSPANVQVRKSVFEFFISMPGPGACLAIN